MKELSFAKKQIVGNLVKITLFFFFLLTLLFISLRYAINDTLVNQRWLDEKFITVGFSILFGYILAFVVLRIEHRIGAVFDKTFRALGNAIKGNIGEKKTFAELEKILDGDYRVYKNFKIPDSPFDIDAIIVGPKGLIVVEIKNLSGAFRFMGEDTYNVSWRYGNECFCKLGKYNNPVRQVLRHNSELEKYLHKTGFENLRPHKTLLMVGGFHHIEEIKKPAVYIVTSLERLKKYIDELPLNPRFTPDFCKKLEGLLGSI